MPNARAAFARLARVLLLAALAAAAAACAATVQVTVEDHEDLSHHRTWSWRPNATANLAAPTGSRSPLNERLARTIARELSLRGYAQSDDAPDLLVGYGLTLEKRTVLVQVPRAPYLLSSLSSSASYWVEGSDLEKQRVSDVTISIGVSDALGRPLWSAEARQRLQSGEKLDLDGSIVSLLERFPARRAEPPAR